jgi:hypothetical protein
MLLAESIGLYKALEYTCRKINLTAIQGGANAEKEQTNYLIRGIDSGDT